MQERPKIAHILYSGLGGHGSVFSSFVAGDVHKQVENQALYYGLEPLNEDYRMMCEQKGISYHYIPKKRGLDLGSWKEIDKQLSKWKPDFLIIHSCYTVIPARRYARKAGIPLVVVEHTANQYKTRLEWLWSLLAMQRADQLVYLTESYREEVKKKLSFAFRQAKTAIIPNGINTDFFVPAVKQNRDSLCIGMHARLASPKDFFTLIRAFALMRQRTVDHKFRLLIAGDGMYREELQKLTRQLGVEKEVDFLGMLNEKEVLAFLQGLDLYVHSTFGETMSTAIMQAMAVRLPIVVSDIEGTRNMLLEKETALFYQNKDADMLAERLRWLADNPTQAEQLAENAWQFARENYSHIHMFSRYLKLIN